MRHSHAWNREGAWVGAVILCCETLAAIAC